MSPPLAVTDTHGLLWYAQARWRRLGRKAKQVFEAAEAGRAAIYVPVVAVVEVLEAARRGLITPEDGAVVWLERLFQLGSFFPADLTLEVVLRAEALHGIPERGDRLIAATAVHLDLPLITRCPAIQRVAGVDVIW